MTAEAAAHLADQAAMSLRRRLGAARVATAGPVYDWATSLWNGAVRQRPAVVVRCRSTADVQAAVRAAREHGLPLSVRAAGHDWAGRAVRDGGVVVDVSGMREVAVDAAAGEATIQAGTTGTDILTAAEPFGLVAVAGNCGGVGMLGLTLGGGYSALIGKFGLAADNLLAAEVVLADGSVVTADREQEPDLFWALRGGGGNFGVVTSARIRLHPLRSPLAGQVIYPWSAATTVLGRLAELLPEAPEELTVHSLAVTTPDGDRALLLAPLWSGDPDAPHPALHALTTLGTPLMIQLGPASLATMAAETEQQFPPGRHVAVRTRTVAGLTPDVVATLNRGGAAMTSPLSLIVLHHFHGAAARVPTQDSAFALRTPHLLAEFVAQWEPGDPDAEQHTAWARTGSDDLVPLALPGGYVNLLGPDAVDQIPHAYGPNTERLLAVKARLDPDSVFAATPLPSWDPGLAERDSRTNLSGGSAARAIRRPGRLGDPAMSLATDPRADPRIVQALAEFGLDAHTAAPPVGPDAPRAELLAYVAGVESGNEALLAAMMDGLPELEGLDHETRTIDGPDGNDITLHIARPADATGPLPGVLHLHGGAMVFLHAANPAYVRFRDELAATGLVVVGVEFRNGGGALGPHPFPAGLRDCAAALAWVHERRAELGMSSLTVAGESGGANLALATAIKAKRDGALAAIDGVYAMVPHISGRYGRSAEERVAELPSLVENDGYVFSCAGSAVLAVVYDPDGTHTTDPLCWPYHAAVEDLVGLPPHVVSVNEVDPLRDEGLAYHRRLVEAGVEARVRTVQGACHGADLIFRRAAPDIYLGTIEDIHRFAASLSRAGR